MDNAAPDFSFSQWLIDGIEGISRTKTMPCFIPNEVKGHLRAANKEVLLACRAMLDNAIECLEKQKAPAQKKVTKIKVQ